ncbi:MAG: hypothetical protein HRF43_10430 [Phycisphaerae bacterium]|jgi:hypothetical protein
MKQSRRHELKTNDLSLWLQQTYAAAAQHANYLIGGAVVVVLILVVTVMVRGRRQDAREQAWLRYFEFQGQSVKEKPELLEQVRAFAEEHRDDDELGPMAALLAADKAAERAMDLDPLKDADKRLEALKAARDEFTGWIGRFGENQGRMVAHARLGLAAVLESLALVGQATAEDVRKQYQAVLALPEEGPHKVTARFGLETLDERLRPLKLVATRPAEPPASAPATQTTTAPASVPPITTAPSAPIIIPPASPDSLPAPPVSSAPAGS